MACDVCVCLVVLVDFRQRSSDHAGTHTFQSSYLSIISNSWCPPCKAIAPVYEELSKKYEGVSFGKVDVDDNSDAALDFEISAVPTFVLFDGEHAIEKFAGADPAKLEEKIIDLQGR